MGSRKLAATDRMEHLQKNIAGIQFYNRSQGLARGNTCQENEAWGIVAAGESSAQIEHNTCDNNHVAIAFVERSRGGANKNYCDGNYQGIAIYSSGTIILRENTCCRNKDSGIYLNGKSAHDTTIYQNRCKENTYGIKIGSSAWEWRSDKRYLKSGQSQVDCESMNFCENNTTNWSWNIFFN